MSETVDNLPEFYITEITLAKKVELPEHKRSKLTALPYPHFIQVKCDGSNKLPGSADLKNLFSKKLVPKIIALCSKHCSSKFEWNIASKQWEIMK